jgi:RNA polymerase sigma factor (sigma-70 family)
MVVRHGAAVLRVANQFSLCHDDALDAYQRALEIYLRKLDTVDPATEGAWLRVVVKHEAMAIRAARLESVDREDVDLDTTVPARLRDVDDEVAGGERVDRSVEALRALKPDEARALLLKAEGLSYQEIGRHFGWSYTKVNRSITEGRARFLKAFSGIEAGEACERYEAALSALAAGTATSADVVAIRPHLRHCATCRATVRDLRFSRGRRLALALPFGWLARLLSRSDVTTNLYAASNGGGRLGPAAAVLGLCLSSVGAGAACVMTGALPAPPLIAHVQHKAKPEPAKKKEQAAADKQREPARPVERISVPRTYTAAVATATPAPEAKVASKKSGPKRTKRTAAGSSSGEFGFEGTGGSPASDTTSSAPVASAASTGGHSSGGSGSGGGGGRTASAPKGPTGGEFGFEGG